MKRLMVMLAFVLAVVLRANAATITDEGTFNFVPLGNEDSSLATHFQIDVSEQYTAGIARAGSITLFNNDPGGSVVTTLWLQGANFIHQQSGGLSFDMPMRPLPGGDTIGFNAALMAGSSPNPPSGVPFGGSYELLNSEGGLFDSPAVEGFESGIYKVAIEVQLPTGPFEYFVNDAVAVPEPSTVVLAALPMLALIARGIRSSCRPDGESPVKR